MHSGGNGRGSPDQGFQVFLNFNAAGDLGVWSLFHHSCWLRRGQQPLSVYKEQGWGWTHLKPSNSFSRVTNKI